MNDTERAILLHAQPPRRKGGYRPREPKVVMREPTRLRRDTRKYICGNCGRLWNARGQNHQCPYCGYYQEAG